MRLAGRLVLGISLVALSVPLAAAEPSASLTPQQAAYEQMIGSLKPQTGTVHLPGVKAALNLGERFAFLTPADARKVLVDVWGNPPETAEGVLGMIFPAGARVDESWGAVITYEETGHITDKDAASQDYASVLQDMKDATEEANADRAAAGYPKMHLAGWAQAPTYDPSGKVLVWARDLVGEGDKEHSLNYDVRSLGRTGVLSLNMVDSMGHLPTVKAAAGALGGTVQFDSGARYADFNPATDEEAEYGLAGLVAAGAGLAAAKKFGLLAILATVGKKAFILLAAGAAGIWGWIKRRFSGDQDDDDGAVAE